MTRVSRAAALLGMCIALLASGARAQAAPDMEILPPPPKDVGFDQHIGQDAPLDATFQNEMGKTIRLGDLFADKPIVLQLAYDTCPMLCSLSAQGLVSSLKAINLNAGHRFRRHHVELRSARHAGAIAPEEDAPRSRATIALAQSKAGTF